MEQVIRQIIEDKLGSKNFTNESLFREDLSFDSLDMLDMIMECEKEFKVCITDDVIDKIRTVQDLDNYIKEHLK